MKRIRRFIALIILLELFCYGLCFSQQQPVIDQTTDTQRALNDYLVSAISKDFEGPFPVNTKISRVEIDVKTVKVFFNAAFIAQPVRHELINDVKGRLAGVVEPLIPGATIQLYAEGVELEKYIPGLYNPPGHLTQKLTPSPKPLLKRNLSNPAPEISAGLTGRYIGLWQSHGIYYDVGDKRWQWQRPRMFTIVEDKLPMAFVLEYLIPMLENAGAEVFCPRERDIQLNEVLVDDADGMDFPNNGVFDTGGTAAWQEDQGFGFKNMIKLLPDDLNPHQAGHHRLVETVEGKFSAYARWTPIIPESGDYAVYISYNAATSRATDAHYIVNHAGGSAEFRINQQLCGNYWVYLGTFTFRKGLSAESGSVVLLNDSQQKGATISADCVKFGGGMGNVIREDTISGYPRYLEGARYWLQYAGVIPELVYKLGFKDGFGGPDYTEDYTARPEWVNYLHGAPNGPNADRSHPGLGVPIDISLAFHTDAGIKNGVCGALLIYKLRDQARSTTFPDGRSRWLNRDLADLIQTQIIDDVRAKYSSTWTRRQIRESDLAEVRRPNVPSALIELLSHQNYDDMKYALDPRFRFDVSRAIYKALLRFIAYEYGYEPVISPLTPTGFYVKTKEPGVAVMGWHPQMDPLEPTAIPTGYIVYTRKGIDGGFDTGRYIESAACELPGLEPNEIYSFKVAAVNAGGISLPGEVLSVCTGTGAEPRALIVNAFDRIAPPEYVDEGNYRGVRRENGDRGVGYRANFPLTGDQHECNPDIKFITNDYPGWGSSYGDLETVIELGNTFDYTVIHGAALKTAGWVFDSVSDEVVRQGLVSLADYKVVDWLLGEERTTPPPPWRDGPGAPDKMQHEFQTLPPNDQGLITAYLNGGGRLFISGAYVATDLIQSPLAIESDKAFLEKVLKCEWVTNHGSKRNNVYPVKGGIFDQQDVGMFHVSAGIGEGGVYGVELADSLRPAKDSGAEFALRYEDAYFNAGIVYPGSEYRLVIFGFPFETITSAEIRSVLMKRIIAFLMEK